MSALHIAASHPNTSTHSLELVQSLLDAKADPNVADSEGLKAVHAAAAVGRAAVVEVLIKVTEPDAGAEEWNALAVQKTVQAKLAAMGAGGGEKAGARRRRRAPRWPPRRFPRRACPTTCRRR